MYCMWYSVLCFLQTKYITSVFYCCIVYIISYCKCCNAFIIYCLLSYKRTDQKKVLQSNISSPNLNTYRLLVLLSLIQFGNPKMIFFCENK